MHIVRLNGMHSICSFMSDKRIEEEPKQTHKSNESLNRNYIRNESKIICINIFHKMNLIQIYVHLLLFGSEMFNVQCLA